MPAAVVIGPCYLRRKNVSAPLVKLFSARLPTGNLLENESSRRDLAVAAALFG
jgi:hypothetical protein